MSPAPRRCAILGIHVDATTYDQAVNRIMQAAQTGTPMLVTALAVHGLMSAVLDSHFRHMLNRFSLVTPDGQPVRWALGWLYGVRLPDRVYGPTLTLRLCEAAAAGGVPIYFYGTTPETLAKLSEALLQRFPQIIIAGVEPSQFRRLSEVEHIAAAERIRATGAQLIFVGLGCPRQEIWAYENSALLQQPVVAVGAAFDFLSGRKSQAPSWMQARGLEWLYRLLREPGRLWKRYLLLNPAYLVLLAVQWLGLKHFDTEGKPTDTPFYFG